NLEAIKKYKLVHALLPADEELKGTIEQLERELHPPPVAPPEPPPAPEPVEPPPLPPIEESPFDRTIPPFEESTGDEEPMLAAHDESPFEEPIADASAFMVEPPPGIQIEYAPVSAEVPALVSSGEAGFEGKPAAPQEPDEADVFAPTTPEPPVPEELTNTLTMADLYARQGLVNEAQHIYENILARDPNNVDVRSRLEAITPRVNPKIDKLERWLEKV